MSLTRLTGAVTVAAATIMESEMDISLMRLHITRSAINQTGWLHHAGRGMGKSEKEKSEGKIKRGIGWTTMTKIKSKCHKIPQCCEGKGLKGAGEGRGKRGLLPACVGKQQMNYMQLIERKFAKYFHVSAPLVGRPLSVCVCVGDYGQI